MVLVLIPVKILGRSYKNSQVFRIEKHGAKRWQITFGGGARVLGYLAY